MSKGPPLRIGVVCFSTFGGSGVVAAEVASSLARGGHAVHLFSDDVPGRLDPAQPNVAFHRVAPPAYPQLKHNLVLAGDWTDTGLPATIEGAIRSGNRAADIIANQSKQS